MIIPNCLSINANSLGPQGRSVISSNPPFLSKYVRTLSRSYQAKQTFLNKPFPGTRTAAVAFNLRNQTNVCKTDICFIV